jgi:phasin family protein
MAGHFNEYKMLLFTQEQISVVQKASAEMVFKVTGRFFDGFEKLTQLNLQVLKATMSEGTEMLQKARDSQTRLGFLDLQAERFAQFPEKVAAYNRHLRAIFSSTQAEVTRDAQRQYENFGGRVPDLLGSVAESASAASEKTALALGSRIIEAPESSCEAGFKATGEAGEAVESDVKAASDTASQASTQTPAQPNTPQKR